MSTVTSEIIQGDGHVCQFNTAFFVADEVAELLADDCRKLFIRRKVLSTVDDHVSSRLQVGGHTLFAREFRQVTPLGRWQGYLQLPVAREQYLATAHLAAAGLRVPAPVLVVVFGDGRRQLYVTEFRPHATSLPQCLAKQPPVARRAGIGELADMLSDMQQRHLYAPALRARGILVEAGAQGQPICWLADCGPIRVRRLFARHYYSLAVANACLDLYDTLSPEERMFLFVSCFDMALKKNVFARPSQQAKFIQSVVDALQVRREAKA